MRITWRICNAIKLCVRPGRNLRFRHRINYQDWLWINVLRTWRRWRKLWHGVGKKLDKYPCIDQRRLHPKLKKVRQSRFTQKSMMIASFSNVYHLHPLGFPNDKAVNKEYYAAVLVVFCMNLLARSQNSLNLASGTCTKTMHSHNSMLAANYLTEMDIKTITHPPYNPNLPPATSGYLRS